MLGYAWFLLGSEDGNFHNQPELSMTTAFLNSRTKLSSLKLSHDFLGMSIRAWIREGRPKHLPMVSWSDYILNHVDLKKKIKKAQLIFRSHAGKYVWYVQWAFAVSGVYVKEKERRNECSLVINNTMQADKGIHGI